jgi:hypothetical protein
VTRVLRCRLHHDRHGETALELPDGRVGLVLQPGWTLRPDAGQCRACGALTLFLSPDYAQLHPLCTGGRTWGEFTAAAEIAKLEAEGAASTVLPPRREEEVR